MAFDIYPITDFNNLNVDWMIQQMSDQTEHLDNLDAGVSANADAIAQEVLDRQGADAGLQYQIDNITAGLTPVLDRTQNVLSKRHVLFVMDSFGSWPSSGNSAADCAADYMGLQAGDWELIYAAAYGFATSPGFYDLLTNASITITRDEITDVVFIAGNNDLGAAENTVQTNMTAITTWIKSNIQNAKVWVMFDAYRPLTGSTNSYQSTQVIYERCAAKAEMTYVNIAPAYHATDYVDFVNGGGVHPTLDGSKALGYAVAQALSGSRDPNGGRSWTFLGLTPGAVVTAISTGFAINCRFGDALELYINPGATWTVNSASWRCVGGNIWNAQGTWYDAADVTSAFFNSPSVYPFTILAPCTFECTDTGADALMDGFVGMRFTSGKLKCTFFGDANRNAGTANEGWAKISKVHFKGGSYTLSAFNN